MASTRQLPGLEDNKIEALEEAAHEYVKYRDKRQQLTAKEVELKADLLRLMKRHKRVLYRSEGVDEVMLGLVDLCNCCQQGVVDELNSWLRPPKEAKKDG